MFLTKCSPYTHALRGAQGVGWGGDSQNPRTFHTAKAPSRERILHLRGQGATEADRPPAPHLQASRLPRRPAVAAGMPEGAGARAGEPRPGRRGGGLGTWSGSLVEPGGGGWGSGRGRRSWAAEAPPRGSSTAARPAIPLAARPGPAHLQWLGPSAPAPPRPGLEPPLSRGRRRSSRSCCRIPAGPPPLSLPLCLDIWTPGPRTARVPETLPAPLGGPAPHGPPSTLPCPDFRLLLDPRFPSLSSPPPHLPLHPQAWTPVGGRGVCALRRPRPAPRDSPCMAGPGGGCGGARAPCGGVTKRVAVPVPE